MKDFLIIGGGIAGLSAAAALAPLGSVTLLEAEAQFATQTSARSAAVFLGAYGPGPVRALNTASLPDHHDWGALSPRPMLMLARAEARADFDHERDTFGATEIPLDEAQALWPILKPGIAAFAARYDGALDIDTDLLVQGYARRAKESGATLIAGAPVTGIARDNGAWLVQTAQGPHAGRHIVNAAGAWADGIAALAGVPALTLQPYRRSMARLAAPGGLDTRAWPVVEEVGERWYAKPDAGAWLVSPAEADPIHPHDAWADDMVIAEGLDRYQDFSIHPITRPTTTWAGLRTFSPDGALVLGPDPVRPDFLWCAGQGGYGFQTAPAAARLLADLVAGRPPELERPTVAALSPARYR